MNRRLLVTIVFCLAAFSFAKADHAIESIQQKLKDEGFYYGEINGKKDANTTAAIRRYQIRKGLRITGEIDAETQRSLGIASIAPSTRRPEPTSAPFPNPPILRREPPARPAVPSQPPADPEDERIYTPGPGGVRPGTAGIFRGTPFEAAPPELQRDVIIDGQTWLARHGFYRGEIDGIAGPELNFALRTYQSRMGLPPTGLLDTGTLASLGLSPGQRSRDLRSPHRRVFPPQSHPGPNGERVYIPN
jgi:peptidoglycan hydrolase-like protein with peptidoglycan-binding domain